MEKIEKMFTTIADGNYGLEIGPVEFTEKQLRNYTDSILCECRKRELKFLAEFINSKRPVDFSLFGGKVEFLIDSESARKIISFQKGLTKSESERTVNKKVLDYIRENHIDSFSPYALVDLYDIGEFTGSIFDTCDSYEDSDIKQRFNSNTYAKGMIEVRDFLQKIKALGYVEGIVNDSASIGTPVEFLEYSIKNGSSSYFGFQAPYTRKATYGKRKNRGR